MTQQQAALQAAQAAQVAASQPIIPTQLPPMSVMQPQAPPVLVPNMSDMTLPQTSPASVSIIPGLGGINTGVSLTSQASSSMPPDLTTGSMGMNFNVQSQFNPDQVMYRSQDLATLTPNQQQQQQSMMAMNTSHLSVPLIQKSMPRFGEPKQMQMPPARMLSLKPQQLQGTNMASPPMRMTSQMHHHRPQQQQQHHHMMQDQQQQQYLHEQQRINLQLPQSRPENHGSLDNLVSTSPSSYDNGESGEGRTNVNLITVPIQEEIRYPPMCAVGGQSHTNNLPFSPTMSSQNFSQSEISRGMNRTTYAPSQSQTMGGSIPSSPSMPPFSQSGNIRMNNNAMMVNPQTGLNVPANALAMLHQALGRPKAVSGLIPIPSHGNTQDLSNPRFNQPNWTGGSQRPIQPRMSQNQQRPRGDGQFQHNYFG